MGKKSQTKMLHRLLFNVGGWGGVLFVFTSAVVMINCVTLTMQVGEVLILDE